MRAKLTILLLCLSFSNLWAQNIVSENMGTPSGTTTIASNTFQNSSSLSYSNGGQSNGADLRTTSPSSTYTGASGGGNIFFTSTAGAYGFSIEGINASNYTSISLQYAYRKESLSAHASFSVDYWNGSSWVTLANTSSTLFNEAAGATTGWYLAKSLSLPTDAQISGLKIRFVKSGGNAIRIDDVKLVGIETPPTVSTTNVSTITSNSGTFGGNVSATGGSSIIVTGIVYAVTTTNANPTVGGAGVTNLVSSSPNSGTGSFTNITGNVLSPNVQYSYAAYATKSTGLKGYGSVNTFYTLAVTPSAPIVTNPSGTSLHLAIGSDSNSAVTNYAIYETTTSTYVQANGLLGAAAVYQTKATWGTQTVSGLSPTTTYTFKILAKNGAGVPTLAGSTSYGTTLVVPAITATGTLSALSTTYGTASSNTTFTVGGTNLTDNIVITAPTGFEVSKTAGGATGYATTQTLIQSSGTVSSTIIYVRLSGSAYGTYSGNVTVVSSNDVLTVNVPTVSSSVAKLGLTISGITALNKVCDGYTNSYISGTATLNGVLASDSANVTLVTNAATANFADALVGTGKVVTITGYTHSGSASGNYSLTQPTGLSADITPNTGSDVVLNSGSTTSNNDTINYQLFQGSQLSNSTSGTNGCTAVMGFYVRDGGAGSDADNLPTELTAITFNVTNPDNILSARLFSTNTPLGQVVSVNGNSQLVFTALSNEIVAPDNDKIAINLRVTFKPNVIDNQQMKFTIASVTAKAGGSLFTFANGGGATSKVTGDINRVKVTADHLVFDQQPTSGLFVGTTMSPSPTVIAKDSFGSIDLDVFSSVALTSSGTLSSSPQSYSTFNNTGVYTFNNVTPTSAGTGLILTASATGLNNATSNTFTVNNLIVPSFTQVNPICVGSALILPNGSNDTPTINGTWSPAINNLATTTYTFTPNAGQNATSTTMTVVVNSNVLPTFNFVGPIVFGGSLAALPTTSNNGINGTWAPALNNTATTTYIFTPNMGLCATTASLTVVVNVIPTFNSIAAICSGGFLSLPNISTNTITGTWSPAINNLATTTYTFTPNPGQNATSTTMTVVVNPTVVPTFNNVPPTERGTALNPLPTTSLEGIPGTWLPALNNLATTTYTFTPSVPCASVNTLTIVITDPDIPNGGSTGGDYNSDGISTTPSYHDTQGKLEISNSGQAVYTLPIALPPSISSVGPTINLMYSSGQSGGIAGQGWNINSISYISRIATRLDIDGFKDGVDFDSNDKLALDGQRLLVKTGSTYWADGSLYETEVQSNSKIQLMGSGSNIYFIVTSPDGSRSWYGNYGGMNATDLSAYYIVRYEDAEGNFIIYNYNKPLNKSLCIDTIQFSANTNSNTSPLNYIKFSYTNAARTENAYFKGVLVEKAELLYKIKVYTNDNLFKEYRLTHTADPQLGYQRIIKIQELNGAGEAANPVVFKYNTTQDIVTEKTNLYTDSYSVNDAPQLTGDFDGDGKMDFVANNKMYLKTFINTPTAPITLPSMSSRRFSGTTLFDNKLNQSQTIIDATLNVDSIVFRYFGYHQNTNSVVQENTKTIAMDNTAICSNACESSTYADANLCNNSKKSAVNYIEGDFNGDGITEVILVRYDESYEYAVDPTLCIQAEGQDPICLCSLLHHTISNTPSEILLINLDNNASTTIGSPGVAILSGLGITRSYLDKTLVGDYNSDGKSDILVVKSNKTYKIYTFNQLNVSPWVAVEVIGEGVLDSYADDKPFLLGDYNGDGKPDIMIPEVDGTCVPSPGNVFNPPVVCPNSNVWNIYYSNPNPAGGVFFTKKPYQITDYIKQYGDDYNSYYALDINKDGKSDLVKAAAGLYFTGSFWDPKDIDSRWRISTYVNNIGNNASGATNWIYTYESPSGHNSDDNSFPIPIVADIKYKGLSSDMLIIRDHGQSSFAKTITYIDFKKSVTVENSLQKVTQSNGAIVDEISYTPMQSSDTNGGLGSASDFYSSNNSVNYPALELKQMPSNRLVSELKNTALGITKTQNFSYNGYIVQLDGVGGIGFKKVARSAWYNSSSDKKTWAVTEIDPLLRGATICTYTLQPSTTPFSFPTNLTTGLMSKTENNFTISAPNLYPYTILLQNQKSTDYITGIVKETVYNNYDTYNLPTSVTNNNYIGTTLQGTTTTITDYDAPSFGTGSTYFIGRPHKTTTTATAYGNTKKSSQTISYVNGNVSEIDKNVYQPDGVTLDPVTMVEKMTYYSNGLLKDKEISAIGTTPGVNDVDARKVSYTYDSTNRFVNTTTDPELLVSTNMSFHPLYGTVLGAKNPFNQATTNVYDNWGKLISVTDNTLNLKTNYSYARTNDIYTTTVTKTTAGGVSDGSGSIVDQDVLSREIRKGSKNLNGTWTYIATEYDAYGRKYRTSEPYFGAGSPSQWTTFLYDDYSRPIRTTYYTGKVANTTYSGLTATVADSVMSKAKTIDANGQTTSTTDTPGGTINYKYDANGSLLESDYNGIKITMLYDNWGRKTQINDPSAGINTYTYNAYGEIKTEGTPKGLTAITYDGLSGRVLTKSIQGLTTADGTNILSTYSYNSATKLLESIAVVNPNDGNSTFAYTYDSQRRLFKTEETQNLLPSGTAIFTKQNTFDTFSRVDTETSSATAFGKTSTKTIKHSYSSNNGAENQIKDNATAANLWQANTVDARGNIKTAALGNGISITNTFDQYGYAHQFQHKLGATDIMTLNTTFEPVLGNLSSRYNSMFDMQEDFTYDALDRLTAWDGLTTNILTLPFNTTTEGFIFNGTSIQGSVSNVTGKLKVILKNIAANVTKDLNINAAPGDKLHIKGDISNKTALSGTTAKLLLIETDVNDDSNFIEFPIVTIANGAFDLDYIVSDSFENAKLSLKFTIEGGTSSGGGGQDPFIDDSIDGTTPPLTAAASFNLDNLKIDKIAVNKQNYDDRGRITNNKVGDYQYDASHPYQNNSINITPNALNYYTGRPEQNVTYNAFKAPIKIDEQDVDVIYFGYNAFEQRSAMYYGDTSTDKLTKPYRKYYSADGSMEIKATFASGNTSTPVSVEFMTYIGGNAYSAPVVVKSDGTTQDYFYLHRDYQGSILAITNATGAIVEKRLFDPWGDIVKVQDGAGNALAQLTFFDRGYTGHEHLQSVGLINMNARLYDPKLHRFLEADNYIQDPSNTQNYNRYGYCLNNPLKYSDVTGNFSIADLAGCIPVIGSIFASLIMGQSIDWDRVAVDALVTGISAAVTFGIGSACAGITNFYTKAAVSALAHGVFQGGLSAAMGGKFWAGFAAGALSSIAASAWEGGTTTETHFQANHNLTEGHFVTETTVHAGIGAGTGAIGTLAFSAIAGGAGSAIGGGNFWQGATTGLIVAGFNGLMHQDQQQPKVKQASWDIDGDRKISLSEANEWYRYGGGQPITVDASKVDLNFVNTSDWVSGNTYTIQTLFSSEEGSVFGNISVKYLGNNQVKILSDTYNFEQHGSYLSSPIRNPANSVGRWVAGDGIQFKINFTGINTIIPRVYNFERGPKY